MKGAIAEPPPTTINNPNNNNTIITGIRKNFLRPLINFHKSANMFILYYFLIKKCILFLFKLQ